MRKLVDDLGTRLFRSRGGQTALARAGSQIDRWRGYGSGAYVATSGEGALFAAINKVTRPGREVTIFDVGANVGDFTSAALATLGRLVRVHAFEPQREVFGRLAVRFRDEERVVLNNCALGRDRDERPLFGVACDSGLGSLVRRELGHQNRVSVFQELVSVQTLAGYCCDHDIEEIDLLKLDVEGFELETLRGAAPLFERRRIEMCSFEFGGCNIDSRTFLRDFFAFFGQYEMRISRLTPGGTLVPTDSYSEGLERFTTTNYVAVRVGS